MCRSEAITPRETGKQKAVPASEWELRGDSAALGGLFLVHILEQKAAFQLQDYGRAVLQAAAFEPPSRECAMGLDALICLDLAFMREILDVAHVCIIFDQASFNRHGSC